MRFPSYQHLQRLHVWGCPVYVLDPKLQDGKKLPKWQPRSRRGQFLGYSPQHSTTIGRILNPRTGYVSPQYHVVYDDQFTTVPNAESGGVFSEVPFDADRWHDLLHSGVERHVSEDDVLPLDPRTCLPALHDDWLTPTERQHRNSQCRQHPPVPPRHQLPSSDMASEGGGQREPEPAEVAPASEGANQADQLDDDALSLVDDGELLAEPEHMHAPEPEPEPEPETELRTRSGRRVNRLTRLIETMVAQCNKPPRGEPNAYRNPKRKINAEALNKQFLMALQWNQVVETLKSADHRAMMSLMEQHTDLDSNTVEWMHPMALAAKANAEDNPTWDQAMNGPDQQGYWEACQKEIKTLVEEKDAWDVVDKQDWMNVLPSTWAFKCKRYPSGDIRKLKARFCAHGDRQLEGINFFDTFAPVVNWTTVRLMS